MDRDCGTATVVQAQAGDRRATDELIGSHLPLVYNIVGRALSGHPDTDDVVQETMLHAVHGLPSLREPASFRSWLVAIAMNQIRRRHQNSQAQPALPGGYETGGCEPADPNADFVDLTIVRLGLSGQRREVAEATRWLDEDDRELLALWWQEAAGQLSRAELAGALELAPQHAAVRVQRMKNQLENARVVVRALSAVPVCGVLAEVTAGWDGVPGTLWRKRIARHVRECGFCAQQRDGLFPAEGLLAGLALVPVPHGHLVSSALTGALSAHSATAHSAAQSATAQAATAHSAAHSAAQSATAQAANAQAAGAAHGSAPAAHHSGPAHASSAGRRAHRHAAGRGRRALPKVSKSPKLLLTALGTAAVTVAAVGVVAAEQEQPSNSVTQADTVTAPESVSALSLGTAATSGAAPSSPAAPSASASASSAAPSPSASATSSPSPSAAASSPTPTATRTQSTPPAAPAVRQAPVASSIQQQVIDLVNVERAKAGCKPVRSNSRLQSAAQGQSDDMSARNFFDHTNPDGAGPQSRIDAAGYQWSTWGENIAHGQSSPADVMDSWMHSPGHRANILNCAFTELGVGVHQGGSGGPYWTQDFGTPS
ncbi:sigma-70 family RNA polymerase sigma factor [Kitasatospora sp. HPMI-4]|uniref:sigma-70 family RNA polymerase sigma factor n=1 Tax=Kitasatospora sp. HPMI-4 TaxID=3448443 RepID=UPI003F1BC8F8